jgi:hypothetical protein
MKAYKVFNPDWTCNGFQYEVGRTYEMKEEPILCEKGFHACERMQDCFSYYSFDPKNKVAEVKLMGKIIGKDGDKQACNKIKIVKEITWEQMFVMVNTGRGNSGHSNSGDSNSGHYNSGDSNSGNYNSGDSNSGNWNSGNRNSGHYNSGDRNSGHYNSGDSNSGHYNSGDSNSGNRNSGYGNSGDRNSGHYNGGDWNSGNLNSGYFNSITPDEILVFNKPCKKILWNNCTKPDFIFFDLTRWIPFSDMTDDEKKNNPQAETTGGYLKTFDYKEAWRQAYDNADKKDIELLKALPNFDAKVFEEITGIKVK